VSRSLRATLPIESNCLPIAEKSMSKPVLLLAAAAFFGLALAFVGTPSTDAG